MAVQLQEDVLSPANIRKQLERILASKGFVRSERMKRFLRYAVEQQLAGDTPGVKEYSIALVVYDKPESFDPRIDPIVRVEANRLRAKLREYYEDEGKDDPVIISIRKGSYAAVFRKKRKSAAEKSVTRDGAAAVPSDSETRHLYLMGRHHWNKRTPEGIALAIESFTAVLAKDPRHALALAGLADCYASQAWFEIGPPAALWERAETKAGKALELDPSLAQAVTPRAARLAVFDWNWSGAEKEFRNAISTDPRYATARHWYGFYCLAPQRRLSAAMEEVMKACALDPLSPVIGTHVGSILYFRRRYQEAMDQYLRAIEVDPGFHLAYWHLGWSYIRLSQFDKALRVLHQARELGCSQALFLVALGCLHAASGNRPEAQQVLDEMTSLSARDYVSPLGPALIHTALDNVAAAFQWLEKAVGEHSCRLIHIKVEPGFDRLKTDSRFLAILASMNLL